jgi:hypothetical protein
MTVKPEKMISAEKSSARQVIAVSQHAEGRRQ